MWTCWVTEVLVFAGLIINANFRLVDRVCLFLAIFLIAYVYGLDGTVRYTYQVTDPKFHESTTENQRY